MPKLTLDLAGNEYDMLRTAIKEAAETRAKQGEAVDLSVPGSGPKARAIRAEIGLLQGLADKVEK